MDGPQHQPYGLTSHLARADQTWPSWRENRRNAYPAVPPHSITGLEPGVEYKVKVWARYGANHPRGLGANRFSNQATQRIDDYRVDIDTTGALTIGEPQDAWVASGGGVDWFALKLRAAYSYDITVDGDEGLRAQLRSESTTKKAPRCTRGWTGRAQRPWRSRQERAARISCRWPARMKERAATRYPSKRCPEAPSPG